MKVRPGQEVLCQKFSVATCTLSLRTVSTPGQSQLQRFTCSTVSTQDSLNPNVFEDSLNPNVFEDSLNPNVFEDSLNPNALKRHQKLDRLLATVGRFQSVLNWTGVLVRIIKEFRSRI